MTRFLALWRPHVLVAALCLGLAASLVVRASNDVAYAAVAIAVAGAAARARALVAVALALLLGGWWWGSTRLSRLDASVLEPRIGEAASMTTVVTSPLRRGAFDLRGFGEVRRFGRVAMREPVLLRLPLGRAPPLGAIVEGVGTVAAPRPEENGFDERAWLRRKGIQVVVRASSVRVVGRRGGVLGLADGLHERLAETVAPGLAGERRAVVAGIVLGKDEGLSDGVRDAFRASGLYHLLAVSGQNIAFLAIGVLGLAWVAGVPRRYAEGATIATIVGYVAAVGWQPSVVRAGVAGVLASLAWLAARPRDRWYALALGAALLLAWNPYSLLEPGFQLSFAAVVAIFVAVPRLTAWLEGYPMPAFVRATVAVSIACSTATAPLVWMHFAAVPLFAVAANALAAPVAGPLLGLGLVAAGVEPIAPPLAAAVSWLNGWLAAYLVLCARVFAALPHAQLTTVTGLGVAIAAVAAVPLALRLNRRGRTALAAAAVLVGVWLVVSRLLPSGLAPPEGLRVTFLDVGQGDAVLVQTAAANVLVDQGPPEADVAAQLRRLGLRRLSLVVLTHPQRDHVGGATDVLQTLDVETVLDPQLEVASADQRAALVAARVRRVPVLVARAGATYRLGALKIRVLWPDGPGLPGEDPNLNATVLLVSYRQLDVLLTADAEAAVTTRLRPPPVEVLKVAHHGSADPLLPQLLRVARPRLAVISVGEDNEYGHPAPSTLAALEATPGLRVYRTDRDGRVTIESDGERVEVRTSEG